VGASGRAQKDHAHVRAPGREKDYLFDTLHPAGAQVQGMVGGGVTGIRSDSSGQGRLLSGDDSVGLASVGHAADCISC